MSGKKNKFACYEKLSYCLKMFGKRRHLLNIFPLAAALTSCSPDPFEPVSQINLDCVTAAAKDHFGPDALIHDGYQRAATNKSGEYMILVPESEADRVKHQSHGKYIRINSDKIEFGLETNRGFNQDYSPPSASQINKAKQFIADIKICPY